MENLNIQSNISNLKVILLESKKYWIIYLLLVILASISIFGIENYLHPKMEILIIVSVSFIGIFIIGFFHVHSSDQDLYKTAFIIILIFGMLCSFLMPICYAPDEVEHFVRSEMVSRGEFIPNYENGSYLTIQSTLDLIEDCRITAESGYDGIDIIKGSIFKTDADTKPINYTFVDYHSAFAQNPFFGYFAQALGMFFAKLLDLNAIWLLWLGRLFNTILYASLVALAIKKTPILKMPLLVMACIPLSIFQISSLSIDALINGLGILMIAYFFYMYKSPEGSLVKKDILIFAFLGLLVGLSKVTYFALIFLVLFVPRNNFKDTKTYLYGILAIVVLAIIAVIWTKFYANVVYMESFRHKYYIIRHINPNDQLNYMLTHKKDTLIAILQIPKYIETDLMFNSRSMFFNHFNSLYLIFLGGVSLFYPHSRFNIKSRIGALLIIILIYFGTYISFLLTWTAVGQLNEIIGVQPRYFLPLFALIPFIFGINHVNLDKIKINNYLLISTITFLSVMLISLVVTVY